MKYSGIIVSISRIVALDKWLCTLIDFDWCWKIVLNGIYWHFHWNIVEIKGKISIFIEIEHIIFIFRAHFHNGSLLRPKKIKNKRLSCVVDVAWNQINLRIYFECFFQYVMWDSIDICVTVRYYFEQIFALIIFFSVFQFSMT